jgi:hypothetical protein
MVEPGFIKGKVIFDDDDDWFKLNILWKKKQ